MLQHAGIEVKPSDLDRTLEFFAILGFTVVPDPFDGGFTWVECAGTQIHLMHEDDPVVPPRAHVAIVCPQIDGALAIAPGGHRVELMKAPPPRAV